MIVAVRVPDHENDRVHRKACVKKLLLAKPKKKCCRSKPRCKKCPLVLHKVQKAAHNGMRGKELEKVYKLARKT
ncbi:hypothetical protein ACWDUN_07095 [Mycobacterium sp. NPDC003323]